MLTKAPTEIRIPPRIISLLIAVLLLWRLTGIAQEQPAPWKSEKGYENGIPIGTKITQANWQQYQLWLLKTPNDPKSLKFSYGRPSVAGTPRLRSIVSVLAR